LRSLGAKYFFYVSGTTTPATVYTSGARTTAAANPVVADSGGLFAPIFLDPAVTYRAILKDSSGSVIQDIDPISDGSLRADLASDSGSTLILHKSADAGTHGRTLRQWAAVGGFDEANVFNWIDDDLDAPITARTNATDLAVFIQAGLNSGRSLIRLPGVGSYKVSALTMSSEIELVGDGPLASGSVLLAANATGDVITTSGSGKNRISGIYFDSAVTRTSGSYIKMGGQGRGLVRDCEFWNGRDGVIIDAVDNITLDNIKLFSMTGDVIRVKQGFNHLLNYVHCDAPPGSQPVSGLHIDAVGDVTVSGCQFLHAGTALLIDVLAGGAVNSVNIDQSYFDTSTVPGLIRSTNTGVIQRLDIANTWFGNGSSDGLSIQKTGSGEVSGIAIHNCRMCINTGDGLKIGAGVTNVRVTGGHFSQNTGSGISAAANSELYLVGGVTGAADGLTGNGVGLTVNSAATGYALGTKISGNTSNLAVSGTGFKLRNTVGALSNSHGTASVTTSASGLASIAHGLSGTPTLAEVNLVESGPNEAQVVSVDGTNINIRVRNTTTDANIASATKSIMWEARL
jgi:hypothetical protein